MGEHQLDKLGVTGSSPVPPIPALRSARCRTTPPRRSCERPYWLHGLDVRVQERRAATTLYTDLAEKTLEGGRVPALHGARKRLVSTYALWLAGLSSSLNT